MTTHLLECTGLSMRFGGLMALKALDIHVDSHEVVGLVGPNGSGKTTFFNVVTGIYHPCAGKVMFDGQDITGLSPQDVYRAGIARTFQRSRLCLDLTVFDNIMRHSVCVGQCGNGQGPAQGPDKARTCSDPFG